MRDESGSNGDACSRFEAAWQTGQQPQIKDFLPAESPEGATLRNLLLQVVRIDLKWRWKTASLRDRTVAKEPVGSVSLPLRPRLADYVAQYPMLGPVEQLPCDLIADEYHARRRYGHWPTHAEYLDVFGSRHPDLAERLQAIDDEMVSDLLNPLSGSLLKTRLRQQDEPESLPISDDSTPRQSQPAPEGSIEHYGRIGRYRIERVLGKGAFGTVYKGCDDELKRPVAIKVPHRYLVDKPEDIELYLNEAQVVARLDHANIVPVHDVGRTDDGLCYVVSKFIEGSDLARRIRETPLSHKESAGLVAAIAEALHHAHLNLVVHRDVKPANILVDVTGKPYLTDFGMALKEEDFGNGSGEGGTAAYLSPEQARGEGQLVDGRTDIFSLGVIFYELLTASRPFWGANREEVIERIRSLEVRPPRQLDDSIPKELERICLRALTKRASDRYTTALDMAEDLRRWLRQQAPEAKPRSPNLEDAVSDEGFVPAGTATREIVLVIDRAFDAFDDQSQRQLLAAIGMLLRIPGGALRVLNKRRGSVLLKLSLPADAAERLHRACEAGELRQFGVVESQLSDLVPMLAYQCLSVSEVGDVTVVRIRNERLIDADVDQFGKEMFSLVEDGKRYNILLDFSLVEFLGSAAIGKLINLNRKVKAQGGILKLINLGPKIHEVFAITGFNRFFDIAAGTRPSFRK